MDLAVCRTCRELKGPGDFYREGTWADGSERFTSMCNQCYSKKYDGPDPPLTVFNRLAQHTHSSAAARGIFANVTGADLKELYRRQGGRCNYTGQQLVPSRTPDGPVRHRGREVPRRPRLSPKRISIDRIDSNKGYTKENIHFVCVHVNIAKGDLPEEAFVEMCRAVVRQCDKRGLPTRAPLMDL
jgi:hypothetical protein